MTRFYSNRFYGHTNMNMCCIFVEKVQHRDHKRTVLKVRWYKLKGLQPLGFMDKITILNSNLNGWYEVKENEQ